MFAPADFRRLVMEPEDWNFVGDKCEIVVDLEISNMRFGGTSIPFQVELIQQQE
jgi:hypothetical protein